MTQLLKQAVSKVEKLSADEQDAIATIILDELADERRWDEAFAGTQDKLARLAERARTQIALGQVDNTDWDDL